MKNIQIPKRDGTYGLETLEVSSNIVIVGANGSGKSKFGAKIEEYLSPHEVKRISAQRLVKFSFRPNTPFNQSVSDAMNSNRSRNTTDEQNDFDTMLTYIYSERTHVAENYFEDSKVSNDKVAIPETLMDKITRIWNQSITTKSLKFEDNHISIKHKDDNTNTYNGVLLSDGEKFALFLITHCLAVRKDSIIIIDEPEIHLHKAMLCSFWNILERERSDCTFIYITHDLDFAISRVNATKIWVKEFDGNNGQSKWVWDFVPNSDEIPENLLLEILGSRKPILFVEGERGSFDYLLFQHSYPDFTIIPRGGCKHVIESTKAMKNNSSLHHVHAYGLIDRDYRTDEDVESLKRNNIYTHGHPDIENLFCIEPVLRYIIEHENFPNVEEKLKEIIDDLISNFANEKAVHVSGRVEMIIRSQFYAYRRSNNSIVGLQAGIDNILNSLNINNLYAEIEAKFDSAIQNREYDAILKFYKKKELLRIIDKHFDLQKDGYSNRILRFLNSKERDKIVDAVSPFLPIFTI